MMSHQKKGIHPRPCGIINLSNIISYGRGTLPYLIEMIEDTIPSDSDTIKHNIHLDDMGNYYLDISADEIKKDNVVIANLNRDLKTQYSNVISAYSALSENGHNLLEATGKGDKMFIVRAFDDLYDSSSDLIFCCIDGSTIYNCSD